MKNRYNMSISMKEEVGEGGKRDMTEETLGPRRI
jgi:hypothetical protein